MMENARLIFPEQAVQSVPVKQVEKSKLANVSDEKKKQVAKDFESLLLNNLLDQMKNTIGSWGFEKDSVSSQVDGIFWLCLSRDLADKGGLGLWKEIYNEMPGNEKVNQSEISLDGNL
ncbi:MAG: hypothetical protein JW787_14900 [Sedimentisphaerales bacterium]|nr:hypothetical protein [Sedimentisphaerales bacterium]